MPESEQTPVQSIPANTPPLRPLIPGTCVPAGPHWRTLEAQGGEIIRESSRHRLYRMPDGREIGYHKTPEEKDDWHKTIAWKRKKVREKSVEEYTQNEEQRIARSYIKNKMMVAPTARDIGITPDKVKMTVERQANYIASYLRERKLDDNTIVTQLQYLVLKGKNENAKIRALELIGKHIGMWKESRSHEEKDLDKKSMDELVAEMDKMVKEMKGTMKKKEPPIDTTFEEEK